MSCYRGETVLFSLSVHMFPKVMEEHQLVGLKSFLVYFLHLLVYLEGLLVVLSRTFLYKLGTLGVNVAFILRVFEACGLLVLPLRLHLLWLSSLSHIFLHLGRGGPHLLLRRFGVLLLQLLDHFKRFCHFVEYLTEH